MAVDFVLIPFSNWQTGFPTDLRLLRAKLATRLQYHLISRKMLLLRGSGTLKVPSQFAQVHKPSFVSELSLDYRQQYQAILQQFSLPNFLLLHLQGSSQVGAAERGRRMLKYGM